MPSEGSAQVRLFSLNLREREAGAILTGIHPNKNHGYRPRTRRHDNHPLEN